MAAGPTSRCAGPPDVAAEPVPIREIEGVDRARFDAEVRPSRQPAIFRGLARDWPAVQAGRTSPEAAMAYLKRFSQPVPVPALVGDPDIEGRFFYTPDLKRLNFQHGTSPLDPFLDRLLRDQQAVRPYAMAVQSLALPEFLPGFVEENGSTCSMPASCRASGSAMRSRSRPIMTGWRMSGS